MGRVVINRSRYEYVFNKVNGPTGRRADTVGRRVEIDAARRAARDSGELSRKTTHDVVIRGTRREPHARIFSPVAHAMANEFGKRGLERVKSHTVRGPNGRTYTRKAHTRKANQRAKPFLRPALRNRNNYR